MTASPRNDEIAAMRILVDLHGSAGPKEWEPYHYDTAEAAGAVVGRYLDRVEKRAAYQRARSERQVERGEANTRTREGNRRPRPRQRRQDPPALVAGKREVRDRSGGYCEAQTSVCDRQAVHVHHIAGRVGKHAHEAVNLLDLCGPCHDYVHAHPEESRERGWMRSRIASAAPEGTEA